MNVEVNIPEEFQGAVMGSLTNRDAVILGTEGQEGYITLQCEVR